MTDNYIVYLIDANENEIDLGGVPDKSEGAHRIQEFLDRYHYQPRQLKFTDLPNGDIYVDIDSPTEHFLMRLLIKDEE